MQQSTWYGFFPYLRTKSVLHMRGLTFRGTNDLADLDTEQRSTVETLRAMFRHHDRSPIEDMVVTIVAAPQTAIDEADLRTRLEEVQSLLTYIHTPPGASGQPILRADHFSFFLFRPDRVVVSLAAPGRAGNAGNVSAALWHGATFSGWPGPQRGSRIADRGKR